MQTTFLQYAQRNSRRFSEHLGELGTWLGTGSVVCVMLAIYAESNGQDLTVQLGALFNCVSMLLGIYCSRRILAAITDLLTQNGQLILTAPLVEHSGMPFALIPQTSLPADGLIRSHRLPPPTAPNISA